MTEWLSRSYKAVMNEELDSRLRENRYEPTGLELDELKRRAMSQASREGRVRKGRSPRLVSSFLALALMLTGGSAVIASTSGTSSGGQPSASISQYEQIVLPERIVPGSARLLAPTGCVARAFNARVSGQNVARVVFTLDGKKIKTLTKPNAGVRFQVRVNPAKMKIGVHRIVATVTFKPETKKAAQTFRISFQRCAKKLAAPRFTG
jgi:hypothetical protein